MKSKSNFGMCQTNQIHTLSRHKTGALHVSAEGVLLMDKAGFPQPVAILVIPAATNDL